MSDGVKCVGGCWDADYDYEYEYGGAVTNLITESWLVTI